MSSEAHKDNLSGLVTAQSAPIANLVGYIAIECVTHFEDEAVDNAGSFDIAHTVTFDLENVTSDYGTDRIVLDGDSFTVNLTASDALDVTVAMGVADITETAYADGTVTIDAVTADVTVTAKAVHTPRDYRWEFDQQKLPCSQIGAIVLTNYSPK